MSEYKTNFNFTATDTAYFVDQKYHMMLHIDYNWEPDGTCGKGDSIGRTFEAYYTYKDKRFLESVKNCWVKNIRLRGLLKNKTTYYYQGYRFPTHDDNDMSRDHLLNTVLIFIASGMSEKDLNEFVTHVPWKISKRYSQSLDLWLWMRAASGVWWAKLLSPVIDIISLSLSVLFQKIFYKLASFSQEMSQDEFCAVKDFKRTKKMKLFSSMLYPSYTITQNAWKIHYMKDSFSKRILKSLLLKIANKHNYVVRLLLDDPNMPTKEQVYSYKSMIGGRWDGILNPEINDRDLHIISPDRYPSCDKLLKSNVLDVDLVRSIYENKIQ